MNMDEMLQLPWCDFRYIDQKGGDQMGYFCYYFCTFPNLTTGEASYHVLTLILVGILMVWLSNGISHLMK